jgi:hypothetical protein
MHQLLIIRMFDVHIGIFTIYLYVVMLVKRLSFFEGRESVVLSLIFLDCKNQYLQSRGGTPSRTDSPGL